jgi:hypothetical protein
MVRETPLGLCVPKQNGFGEYQLRGGIDAISFILDRLEEILIVSLMAGATLVIFVAVLHRHGTDIPFLYP